MEGSTDRATAPKLVNLKVDVEPVAAGGLTPALMDLIQVEGLHCGCGTALHRDWLNMDIGGFRGRNGVATRPGDLVRIAGRYFYCHDVTRPLGIADGTVRRVFSEHMIEHLPMPQAVAWLADVRRMLAAGGRVRISTPDLALYVDGYRDPEQTFFRRHHDALKAMGMKHPRLGRAWMMNQLFRLWGHEWIYDFDALAELAIAAGFPPAGIARAAFRKGADPQMASLDREDRRDESIYVELVKTLS